MTAVDAAGTWTGLSYGATERLLAGMQETSVESIRTRFRKLRLRPFPDEIRSGTGIRVSYDLPRLLALAAVFELSRLQVPQGQAVDVVEAGWPEWCRACVSAAVTAGAAPAVPAMPSGSSSLLGIVPDAFQEGGAGSVALFDPAREGVRPSAGASPAIVLDAARSVRSVVLAAGAASRAVLADAFSTLERAFGWTPPALPHRASVAALSRGRGFLDEGPYFDRAEALLRSPDEALDAERRPSARRRLEWLLSYVEDPAPIDRWKAEVGAEEDRPRLKHLIGAWAERRGLEVAHPLPATMLATAEDPGVLALDYIRKARRVPPVGEDAV